MNTGSRVVRMRQVFCSLAISFVFLTPAHGQTCLSAGDMGDSTRSTLESTAKRYFDMSARGDGAALKQNAIPSLASSFGGVENAIKDNQTDLAGATAIVRPPFLLNAEGSEPLAHAEFLCGVFGKSGQTSNSAVFDLNSLPPGKYAVTILDISGGKAPLMLTMILQQMGSDWKLAGFYTRRKETAGHDAGWFLQQARDFKSKSQNHNAWLYYREAISLSSPVDFMSTQATDKLYEEIQEVAPADMPTNGKTIDLSGGGKTYTWTTIFPLAVGQDLDVVVKYSVPDISNTQKAFEDNAQVMRALLVKFPELRSAFAGVVARAVGPSGDDYGSMLPMKDIK